jgi:pimeloyl-ACP methyl ester carboxylesterase
VQVRGVELNVRDEGEGRLLVWGHGLMADTQVDDAVELLAPRPGDGVRVVRYDARGHGRSDATLVDDDYNWRSLAQDMLGVLDGVGAETAVLGGASMGAATALHAAVAAPQRVEGLVLAIPPTAWGGRRVQAGVYRAGATIVRTAGLGPFVTMGRAAPPPKILTGDLAHVRDAMFDAMQRLDIRVVPHIMRGASKSDLPAKEALAELAVPTLIVAWKGDSGHPLSTANEVARLLPNAELHVASNADDVKRWPSLVTGFVRGL